MHRLTPAMRNALFGTVVAATFIATTHGQSILGPPSEANHFIETPKGWVHPKTASGDTDPSTPQRQTNLIVDPPDGMLPAVTAEGKRRALTMGSSWALPGEDPAYEDPLSFDFWDNCRSRGMPSSMMPYRYNGGFKIRQSPGVVVFDLE